MFRYTNPDANEDIYIVVKYILTIECHPEQRLMILEFVNGAPKMRLYFTTDEGYSSAKNSLIYSIQKGGSCI